MDTILKPSHNEVSQWLLATIRHVFHVEYFLHQLEINVQMDERPHDIVGLGNKFEWDIIRGLALQYRKPEVDFEKYIAPARELHRDQYHHRLWNFPDSTHPHEPVVGASFNDMMLSAIDAVCSLLENRGYQGGAHNYDEASEIIQKNSPIRKFWCNRAIEKMKDFDQPELNKIFNLEYIPNIGIPEEMYQKIINRLQVSFYELHNKYGYNYV